MAGAQEVDAEREDYVVSIIEFAGDTQNAQSALQRLFALSEADARAVLREAPVAVRRGVNRIRAEYFRRALELTGARVEVRDGDGALLQAQAELRAGAARVPPAASPPTAAAPQLRESGRASPYAATLMMGGLQLPPEADEGPSELALQDTAPPSRPAPHQRESGPGFDAIPAGERWKAPGAATLAKAQRRQQVQALESGMGDMRPSPMPAAPLRAVGIPEATARTAPKLQAVADLNFWQVARLPLSGHGLGRIMLIATGSLGLGMIAKLAELLPWLGAPLLVLGVLPLLALCVEYQRSTFWATATGDRALEARPRVRARELIQSGLPSAAVAAVSHLLLWVWLVNQWSEGQPALSIVTSPALWVLGFGPSFYWSVALGCAAARNDVRGVWDVAQCLRALGRAPLPLAQVALASGCTFALSLVISTALLSALQLGPMFTVCAAAGLPLALSHGLMGAWLGRVLRSHPDLFE